MFVIAHDQKKCDHFFLVVYLVSPNRPMESDAESHSSCAYIGICEEMPSG